MTHALVTIVAPLDVARLPQAEEAVALLGNPAAPALAEMLGRLDPDGSGTHFASLHAFRSPDGARAYLLLEFSADGAPDGAARRIVAAIGDPLARVFALARDRRDGDLASYLLAHRVKEGVGPFSPPGLAFAGTPGMSVGRIRREARLAAAVSGLVETQPPPGTALERLVALREAIARDPELRPLLDPADASPPFAEPSRFAGVLALIGDFVRRFLWPVGVLILVWALIAGVMAAWAPPGWWPKLRAFVTAFIQGAWSAAWVALAVIVAIVVAGYIALRRKEARDHVDDRPPDHRLNTAMFERENRAAQNHMISVIERKPGLLRGVTLRLVFWAIGAAAGRLYPPGFLGSIGTIHFARWVTMPGSRDLVFLSNYGGSWQSYLEDFITRAHNGLTGVWSNSIGFPRTENLVGKGATDGERFKRYARRSMVPTGFWFSAYPSLTTATIRTNAQLRRGLSGAMTEDEAARFFALFGSAPRPRDKLVSSGIQSLAFGGLGFMPAGLCLIQQLPDDRARARAWLRAVRPRIAWNDGRRLKSPAVVTLALGASGLAKLGLPPAALDSFPYAFLEGMTGPARARVLGDTGEDAAEHWWWGRERPDSALLLYGEDDYAVAALRADIEAAGAQAGVPAPHVIPLKPVTADKREPFGFADGISQPVIRGTYKGFRDADPIHLVEPGEFIGGYPDNRGDVPPGPTMDAIDDPENLLPLVGAPAGFDRTAVELPRDLGFNGSFLVIRQLEQHVAAFDRYCAAEAERAEALHHLPAPYQVTPEFIGAKMVGRWKDGSSLARFPYEPRSSVSGLESALTFRPVPRTASDVPPIPRPPEHGTKPDNDFLLGAEDPEAIRCPFGAHIRRSNPRDSQEPGSAEQIGITNRHRIIRVGRFYQEKEGEDPGLLFMCLAADIERQFEFLQQTWLKSPSFHGLSCEKDPLLGDAEEGACGYTIPTRGGPVRLSPMPRFVTVRGGGYFFMPGKRLLDWLAAGG